MFNEQNMGKYNILKNDNFVNLFQNTCSIWRNEERKKARDNN